MIRITVKQIMTILHEERLISTGFRFSMNSIKHPSMRRLWVFTWQWLDMELLPVLYVCVDHCFVAVLAHLKVNILATLHDCLLALNCIDRLVQKHLMLWRLKNVVLWEGGKDIFFMTWKCDSDFLMQDWTNE